MIIITLMLSQGEEDEEEDMIWVLRWSLKLKVEVVKKVVVMGELERFVGYL